MYEDVAGRMRENKLRQFAYVLRKVDNDGIGKNISEISIERSREAKKEWMGGYYESYGYMCRR